MRAGIKAIIMVALGLFFIGCLVFLPKAYADADPYPQGQVVKAHPEDENNCTTAGEFNHLKYGMTKYEVRKLLDGPGRHQNGAHPTVRWWPICGLSHKAGRVMVVWNSVERLRQSYWMVLPPDSTISFARTSDKQDTRRCATAGEWNQVNPRMSRREAIRIMDTPGKLIDHNMRQWPVCPEYLKPGHTAWLTIQFRGRDQIVETVYWVELSRAN